MQRRTKLSLFTILLTLSLFTSVLSAVRLWANDPLQEPATPTSSDEVAAQRFRALRLEAADFPSRWYTERVNGEEIEVTEGVGYYYRFQHRDNPITARTLYDIYITQSVDRANALYLELADDYQARIFDQREARVPVALAADSSAMFCSPTIYDGVYTEMCSLFARYEDIVLDLNVVLYPEQYFTLEDFERLLGIIDAKAQRALEIGL